MKQLGLPLILLGILAGFLLPLPGIVVDVLIVANIAAALLLLFSVLYIQSPLQLSALPGILLLLTLFRLALNVSTTRMILGSSGSSISQVIQVFGNVVIQGQIAVGICIFFIITLIQFIVIAKGSERVAEVSARFVLDALPGQQMSIDADLRSGFITPEEARDRRNNLQVESRFYGALDGSMKFVKGDAIAGLFVTFLNAAGGLCIGVFSHGMEVARALDQYTLLTIGDGLSSQLPALLNSLAAGMIVTRVQKGDEHLAFDVISQISSNRQVRISIGLLLVAAAFATSFPFIPLALPGLFLILTSCMNGNDSGTKNKVEESPPGLPQLAIDLAAEVAHQAQEIQQIMQLVLRRLFIERGLLCDMPRISYSNPGDHYSLALKIRGQTVFRRKQLPVDHEKMEVMFWNCLCENETLLIDDRMARRLLLYAESEFHDQVNSIVPGIISVTRFTLLLRGLLQGGIPVRNIDIILQAVAEAGLAGEDDALLLGRVRNSMGRIISSLVAPDGTLYGFTFSEDLDRSLCEMASGGSGSREELLNILHEIIDTHGTYPQVLAVSASARAWLEELYLLYGGRGFVVAHDEIQTSVQYKCKVLRGAFDETPAAA